MSLPVQVHRPMYGDVRLYSGTSAPELSNLIAKYLDVPLCDRDIVTFPNDNIFVKMHCTLPLLRSVGQEG